MRLRERAVLLLVVCIAISLPSSPASAYPYPGVVNGDVTVRDPSVIVPGGNTWFLYSSFNQARVATGNRVTFTSTGLAHLPQLWWGSFSSNNTPWAPNVTYYNGTFRMYYAVSNPGSQRSAIGLGTSSSGYPGTWTDNGGPILQSSPGDAFNAIDPALFVDWDTGAWWLTFGSHWGGIYIVRVDPSTGLPTGAISNIARNPTFPHRIEGPNIIKIGGYYYLFASFDDCCVGLDSTYNIRVGRSTSPLGPYVDKAGARMLDGGGSIVLQSHDWVRGPGGQDVYYDPWDRRHQMVYHYWDARKGEVAGTQFGINYIDWDASGWPYLN